MVYLDVKGDKSLPKPSLIYILRIVTESVNICHLSLHKY